MADQPEGRNLFTKSLTALPYIWANHIGSYLTTADIVSLRLVCRAFGTMDNNATRVARLLVERCCWAIVANMPDTFLSAVRHVSIGPDTTVDMLPAVDQIESCVATNPRHSTFKQMSGGSKVTFIDLKLRDTSLQNVRIEPTGPALERLVVHVQSRGYTMVTIHPRSLVVRQLTVSGLCCAQLLGGPYNELIVRLCGCLFTSDESIGHATLNWINASDINMTNTRHLQLHLETSDALSTLVYGAVGPATESLRVSYTVFPLNRDGGHCCFDVPPTLDKVTIEQGIFPQSMTDARNMFPGPRIVLDSNPRLAYLTRLDITDLPEPLPQDLAARCPQLQHVTIDCVGSDMASILSVMQRLFQLTTLQLVGDATGGAAPSFACPPKLRSLYIEVGDAMYNPPQSLTVTAQPSEFPIDDIWLCGVDEASFNTTTRQIRSLRMQGRHAHPILLEPACSFLRVDHLHPEGVYNTVALRLGTPHRQDPAMVTAAQPTVQSIELDWLTGHQTPTWHQELIQLFPNARVTRYHDVPQFHGAQ